jgi:hypothetical protein
MATPISRDDRRAVSCSGLRPSPLTAPKTYTTRRDITFESPEGIGNALALEAADDRVEHARASQRSQQLVTSRKKLDKQPGGLAAGAIVHAK